MDEITMGSVEARFAEIIWKKAPIRATELIVWAKDVFGWKKTTTYTVLKRLCEKGLFYLESGVVRVIVTKSEYDSFQSRKIVNEGFGGSLPAFIAAFAGGKPLTYDEICEIMKLIECCREENGK